MITEDKVTEIFCIADYFCKVFDEQMAKYTFKAERKLKYHRESRMSKAEIMVITIIFHSSGYRCLKHFHLEKVCKHMCHLLPKVVSYNHFVEPEREIAIPLIVLADDRAVAMFEQVHIAESTLGCLTTAANIVFRCDALKIDVPAVKLALSDDEM